ncbi:DNA-binding transcriptional regulator, IclR family [Salinihabitans flavidus]|uniref:DNA-binding transcriptional regulator, IclR family n=1 Tax=Salinihabitans flavidus TaxID=569882 RepID=A0A1H8U9V7_9RHOB|nr:IclR family transcriptional regulator [Salinihabitans flavidus]SEP00009.1 DNA-binding transcriptional regulator, IclR family [Salinihabitans flavidus]
METDDDDTTPDYRRVTALERGLSVLRAFGPGNRPLGNAEISQRVGLPKPTVSRITFTLTELGYLLYLPDVARYRLGPAVLTLGYDVLAQMGIREIARPLMQELANETEASVFLGVPTDTEIIYVESCRSPTSMTIRLDIGSRIPLATTGMGRAYLAALPEDELEALLVRIAPKYGSDWPEVENRMRRALTHAQKAGFALSIGEWIAEANSAGVVIQGSGTRPSYILNIGGLRSIITAEKLRNELAPRLVALARHLEHVGHGLF